MSVNTVACGSPVHDKGIEYGISRLTDEKVTQVINDVLSAETGSRLKMYVKMCLHCGLCSEGCHFYLSHDKDPAWSPAGKVKQTIGYILKHRKNLDREFIRRAVRIASTECNLCRRCVMYCPFGVDVAYMMTVIRRICHKLGVIPQYIQDTAHSHATTYNQMWINEDEWIDCLQWQEDEAREEIPDLRIPIDKEGADVFYSVIGPEPKFRPQLILQAAVIMNTAGVDWTMCSMPGWDNSDMGMYAGDNEIMGRLKKAHFEAAVHLRTKRIVMGECGHAFRSVYDVGNRWLGWRMPPIPVIHAIEFYYELFTQGKIRVREPYAEPVTFHDPCNIIRGRGLHEMARHVVRKTCREFIEMIPNREHNFCCGAGGGVINCGPPFKNKRIESTRVKAEQLFAVKAKGAKTVIAPCHNCHSGLEDIIAHHGLDMEIKFLSDIIYETMEQTVKKAE